jgi:hypothetical protein
MIRIKAAADLNDCQTKAKNIPKRRRETEKGQVQASHTKTNIPKLPLSRLLSVLLR